MCIITVGVVGMITMIIVGVSMLIIMIDTDTVDSPRLLNNNNKMIHIWLVTFCVYSAFVC